MDYDAYDALLHHIFKQVSRNNVQHSETSSFIHANVPCVIDPGGRLVQTLGREHPCGRLPPCGQQQLPSVPLRERISRTV